MRCLHLTFLQYGFSILCLHAGYTLPLFNSFVDYDDYIFIFLEYICEGVLYWIAEKLKPFQLPNFILDTSDSMSYAFSSLSVYTNMQEYLLRRIYTKMGEI
jgi:hypothetical protein